MACRKHHGRSCVVCDASHVEVAYMLTYNRRIKRKLGLTIVRPNLLQDGGRIRLHSAGAEPAKV